MTTADPRTHTAETEITLYDGQSAEPLALAMAVFTLEGVSWGVIWNSRNWPGFAQTTMDKFAAQKFIDTVMKEADR
jgi:hypothetical protein